MVRTNVNEMANINKQEFSELKWIEYSLLRKNKPFHSDFSAFSFHIKSNLEKNQSNNSN